jgi:rubrerythrin
MGAIELEVGQRNMRHGFEAPNRIDAAPKAQWYEHNASLGVLYAHALAMQYEAEARYRELAYFMDDCGHDAVAELFLRLAENEAQYALHLVMKSVGIEIPVIDPGEYAWLVSGGSAPEARALVFRMMTPRTALQIALRAKKQAREFFMRELAGSRDAGSRDLAAELAVDQELHLDRVEDALARLPRPLQPGEEPAGDPTIEQSI